LQAASSVTIAVIDTGADLRAPDLAAKTPRAYNVRNGTADVRDHERPRDVRRVAGRRLDDERRGLGRLRPRQRRTASVVKASQPDGSMTDLDEPNAIVYAVDHGARVII